MTSIGQPTPSVKLLLLSAAIINFLASNAQDIRQPPSIVVGPVELGYYPAAARVALQCVASGYPSPTMSWQMNNAPLSYAGILPTILPPGNGTIEIVQMSALSLGNYQCFASNQYGRTMTNISIVQLANIDLFDPNAGIANVTVQANAALTLKCNPPSSVPAASFKWLYTVSDIATIVTTSKSVQIDYNGDLRFASINVSDTQGRIYRCDVFNKPQETTRSGSYSRITVQGSVSNVAPQLVFSSSTNFIGLRSVQTVLRCFFSGSATIAYQWTYNGASTLPPGWTVFSDTDLRSPENGTRDSDAGTFTCYGNNGQGPGPASANITLTVEAIPDFGGNPNRVQNVNVTQGGQVTFSCATGAIPTATVQWFKNTVPFNGNSLPPKFSLSADLLTLTIANLCKNCSDGTSDLMAVQCNSSNRHGYGFAQGYINVLLPTVIESKPTSVPWVPYQTYTFGCLSTCDDNAPCSSVWYFSGVPIVPDGRSTIQGSDGSLTINTANDSDAGAARIGNYECIVTNGYSRQQIACSITGATAATAEIWWVGILVALLILLLLLLVLCCCFFCYYRVGKSYPVDKNERKNGNDPVKELHSIGFQEHVRSKNEPINIHTNPSYGRSEAIVAPPIYNGHTVDYKVNTVPSTPSGSRVGESGSRNSPAGSIRNTQTHRSAHPANGNHSWNASEV